MTSGKYDRTELHLQGTGQYSTNMQQAAELLALPSRGGFTLKEISDKSSISERQLRTWRNDPRFQALVAQKTRQNVKEVMPDVLNVVIQRAMEGSGKHAELIMKYESLLTDKHEITANMPENDRRDLSEFDERDKQLAKDLEELKELIDEAKGESKD
ncbi:hypothetical protein JMM81_20765 [Bacillus sp. V3B]|uniref:phBC6A51 family helix-turn-helix protein n=1 Tax=Bacillus sp. V3B TaxID=2804915 RepID=UPI00210CD5D1|nr:phBC6A51 family helix-turn-helix protein [Bacillus sp. V3B]MCQ6277309.1 hypothetical protein [Bacillus sp. V3B]